MKIFNWVHRKFYQKDGLVGRNVKIEELKISNDTITVGIDTQTLLQDATFAHMFLTIGTLGFDTLRDVQDLSDVDIGEGEEQSLEEEYLEDLDDQEYVITVTDQEEHEELYPLINANIGHDVVESPKENEIIAVGGSPLFEKNESNLGKKLNKERITLADLFSADSDHHGQNLKENSGKTDEAEFYAKKPAYSEVKKRKSFAKNLIPRVKEDSHPIKKLQQLMTRVLKRKVHPDIETKSSKNTSQVKAASMLGLSCVKHVRVDSTSAN